jgi:hypothetical protein
LDFIYLDEKRKLSLWRGKKYLTREKSSLKKETVKEPVRRTGEEIEKWE